MTTELARLRALYHEADALFIKLRDLQKEAAKPTCDAFSFVTFLRSCVLIDKARMRRDRRRAAFVKLYNAEREVEKLWHYGQPCPLVAQTIAEYGPSILTPAYRAIMEARYLKNG